MIVKEWVGGPSGLRYRLPSIVQEKKRKEIMVSYLRYDGFPLEELSRPLANDTENIESCESDLENTPKVLKKKK